MNDIIEFITKNFFQIILTLCAVMGVLHYIFDFRQIFNFAYRAPAREPKLGHYSMLVSLLILLFIGFNRIWHFTYLRLDAMLCGFFNLPRLPVASTSSPPTQNSSRRSPQSVVPSTM